METSKWWAFVQNTIAKDLPQTAANKAGFDKSNFSRWKRGARPDVDFVVKLCRAYQVNVLAGLASAGFITEEEAELREVVIGMDDALAAAELDQLLDEIRRRFN